MKEKVGDGTQGKDRLVVIESTHVVMTIRLFLRGEGDSLSFIERGDNIFFCSVFPKFESVESTKRIWSSSLGSRPHGH